MEQISFIKYEKNVRIVYSLRNITNFSDDPCDTKYCGRGHECQIGRDGQAQCVCQRHCKKHRKLVCGSDGNLYLNHCELHRASCLMGKAITIDRKNTCLRKKGKNYQKIHYIHTSEIVRDNEVANAS